MKNSFALNANPTVLPTLLPPVRLLWSPSRHSSSLPLSLLYRMKGYLFIPSIIIVCKCPHAWRRTRPSARVVRGRLWGGGLSPSTSPGFQGRSSDLQAWGGKRFTHLPSLLLNNATQLLLLFLTLLSCSTFFQENGREGKNCLGRALTHKRYLSPPVL